MRRAAEHIDADDMGDGRWMYYAHETTSYWVVDAEALETLCDYLDNEGVSGDAYSRWCAQTGAVEMPRGWTPRQYTMPRD